jgi:tRNA1(Val) A37 N6-methylase TrmN6
VKSDEAESPAYSVDAFLGGCITLVQPLNGHRAGLDAALLQAIVPADATGRAVDLGSGVGTVTLALAARAPALTTLGVERDASLIACASAALQRSENAAFSARVAFVEADVAAIRALHGWAELAERSADWVLMNPPWDTPGRVRASPDSARRAAHVAEPGALGAWSRAAAYLLKAGGVFGLIHRTAALPEILEALAGQFGDVRILPVHPAADAPASRVLVRAMRESRAGLQLLPGLVLHEAGGAWTPRADALLRGEAELAF